MTIDDILFFNDVRNDSIEFLHQQTKYTLEDNVYWYIYTKKDPYFICEVDGEPIGYFRTSEWGENEPYIGMDISKVKRGNGYATTAYKLFFELLQTKYGVKKVHLEVVDYNERAKTYLR